MIVNLPADGDYQRDFDELLLSEGTNCKRCWIRSVLDLFSHSYLVSESEYLTAAILLKSSDGKTSRFATKYFCAEI